jgi:hypothetical protein
VNLYGSIYKETSELASNKFYVIDAKPEKEVYKLDIIKYLQAYQANTAYQIKKLLEFKQDDPEFK